jgi:hypothetical protein
MLQREHAAVDLLPLPQQVIFIFFTLHFSTRRRR